MGILSPHPEHRNRDATLAATHTHVQTEGQVTPPETPAPERQMHPGDKEDNVMALRAAFETSSLETLTEWANGLGRWLYV